MFVRRFSLRLWASVVSVSIHAWVSLCVGVCTCVCGCVYMHVWVCVQCMCGCVHACVGVCTCVCGRCRFACDVKL